MPETAQYTLGAPEVEATYEIHYQEHRRPEWWTLPNEFNELSAAQEFAEKLAIGQESPRGNPRASVARVRIMQRLVVTTVIHETE